MTVPPAPLPSPAADVLPPSVQWLRSVPLGGGRSLDEQEPWALPLVVRLERDSTATHTAVLEAAARAVLELLSDDRVAPDGDWHASVARWLDGRIRKVVRRARASRWEAVLGLPGATAAVDGAQVRALLPHPVAAPPAEVGKLQVSGLELTDERPDDHPATPGRPAPNLSSALRIVPNPAVTMTTGKAAAQAGHAAQLALTYAPSETVLGWWQAGCPLQVGTATEAEWREAFHREDPAAPDHGDVVVVRDGGFTEVAPGTATVLADWRALRP
ncbi:MAG: peptidyl-tRNA hydrolase [Motilibacteraceae bacterium]